MYEKFKEEIRKSVKFFKDKNCRLVKIVSHNDCDGICAAAILTETFRRSEIKFSLSIVKRLSREALEKFGKENWDALIFSDLGSSHLKDIKEIFGERTVIILDHHIIGEVNEGSILINPHRFGIDSYHEISGAGVAYLFSKYFDQKNLDLSYLALIGAIGDIQGEKGFSGLNKEILEDAINIGKVESVFGLRNFGYQTKPLHKMLEYSTDPYIPGITGNEMGVINFLEEIGIKYKDGDDWLRLIDLDKEELKKLTTEIIIKRMGSEEKPEDIFGDIYLLKEEEEGSPTKDMKEFSTLLNACGRMEKPAIGISACLNRDKTRAVELMKQYKRELINAMNWFNKNKLSNNILEGKGFCIVNAKNNIKDTIIGVLASMISKSNIYEDGTILVFMANTPDNQIKFSSRLAGRKEINLKEFFSDLKEIGADIGGHKYSVGGTIDLDKEKELIEFLKRKFE